MIQAQEMQSTRERHKEDIGPMREPPVDLADDLLGAALRTHYALAVRTLTFLPLGHDSSAWVYRVHADDEMSYFLKVRTSMANAPSLLVPRYLHEHGVTQVVAPLPTVTGALWAEVAGYALILYPFIAGITGMAQGMAPEQWTAYGAILRQIHDMAVTPQLAHPMRRETFVPAGAATVREVDGHIGQRSFDDPITQTLAALWRERRDLIHTLVSRAEDLGRQVAQKALPFVLCHADIHTDNVLLAADGQVWIVDWDETLLAPKERDLMFVVGGGISRELVGLREEELFLRGYGATPLDSLVLSYYRYAWAVSDIGEYGAQIVVRPDLGEVSRQAALKIFLSLFKPGEIVALALASNEGAD
jgi:spectinomycin phosphotransferase